MQHAGWPRPAGPGSGDSPGMENKYRTNWPGRRPLGDASTAVCPCRLCGPPHALRPLCRVPAGHRRPQAAPRAERRGATRSPTAAGSGTGGRRCLGAEIRRRRGHDRRQAGPRVSRKPMHCRLRRHPRSLRQQALGAPCAACPASPLPGPGAGGHAPKAGRGPRVEGTGGALACSHGRGRRGTFRRRRRARGVVDYASQTRRPRPLRCAERPASRVPESAAAADGTG